MSQGRLLYVVNNPAFFLSHRLPLARAARAMGLEPHLAAPRPEEARLLHYDGMGGEGETSPSRTERVAAVRRTLEEEGIPLHPVSFYRPWLHPWRDARTAARLLRLYRRLRPRIVHHVTYKAIVLGSLAARVTGVPAAVNAVSGFGELGQRPGLKGALVRAGLWVALGHENQVTVVQNRSDRDAVLAGRLAEPERIALVRGSGVDTERFAPDGNPAKPPLVLFAARMVWSKGVREFVEAARRLRDRYPEARFVLAGDPDPENRACVPEKQLRAWDRDGPMEWWGYRADMPELLRRAAVVCLPTSYGEGVPRVLIEAAACGRPVVASDTPGCREVVRDGENGLLVDLTQRDGVAEAIGRLLEKPELRERLGRRGREIAVEEFALESVVEAHRRIYGRLLGAARVSAGRRAGIP